MPSPSPRTLPPVRTKLTARLTLAAFAVSACAIAIACSEATDGLVPPGADFDAGAAERGSESEGGRSRPSGTSSGETEPGETRTLGSVLINEVSKDDWVEIVNSGSEAVDLGGWVVADRDKDTGEPKLEDAVTFPPGTKLGANTYGMVIGGGVDAGNECPAGGQVFCVEAEFGISKSGETIFLLQPDGGLAGSVAYPAEASVDEMTWSRVPSGDPKGDFTVVGETPGSANKTP